MAFGGGAYEKECVRAFRKTKARCAILIVFGGDHGNGFSMTADSGVDTLAIADVLENMARQLRADMVPKGSG